MTRFDGEHKKRRTHVPKFPENPTHYSYLSCPVGVSRQPTALLDLEGITPDQRRTLIHNMMMNGELVAELPELDIKDMKTLRAYLKWEHENNS